MGRSDRTEYLPEPCVIELECLASGWIFDGVYGPQNTIIGPETTQQIVQNLYAAGVQVSASHMQASRYNRVARLAGALDLFRDDLDQTMTILMASRRSSLMLRDVATVPVC
ncbi:hypothetical protein [Microvirga pakistanensis]|uniref:hypothetical protein n=1 Tax=Microvirga pakistanensis TaxID=1682650 RepID=UPI00106ABEC2|nr:hypothetical protein [Microvirga pakistanensis]